MMSDYSRTQELVTAANTSAGASNEQFEKTLESLESKLNNLKNSWDTFTMSLMNNEVVKIGIDILTALMDTINGVVALFDKFGLGSAASIGMVVAALSLGAKALNSFEAHMMAVDDKGKRLNTTLGSIRKVGAEAFNSMKKAAQNTAQAIKGLPKELQKVGVAAKASAKNINKMQSDQFIKARKAYAAATKEAADAENHWNVVSMRANATSA
jgi:septation ring formation regulator EzrA